MQRTTKGRSDSFSTPSSLPVKRKIQKWLSEFTARLAKLRRGRAEEAEPSLNRRNRTSIKARCRHRAISSFKVYWPLSFRVYFTRANPPVWEERRSAICWLVFVFASSRQTQRRYRRRFNPPLAGRRSALSENKFEVRSSAGQSSARFGDAAARGGVARGRPRRGQERRFLPESAETPRTADASGLGRASQRERSGERSGERVATEREGPLVSSEAKNAGAVCRPLRLRRPRGAERGGLFSQKN